MTMLYHPPYEKRRLIRLGDDVLVHAGADEAFVPWLGQVVAEADGETKGNVFGIVPAKGGRVCWTDETRLFPISRAVWHRLPQANSRVSWQVGRA